MKYKLYTSNDNNNISAKYTAIRKTRVGAL